MGYAAEVLERLLEIENSYDDYWTTATAAHARGIGPAMLNELENRGLPHEYLRREKRYSRKMLQTLGLYLDVKSPEFVAMRYWMRTGSRLDKCGSLRVAVSVSARASDVDPGCVVARRPDGAAIHPAYDGEVVSAEHVVRLTSSDGRSAPAESAFLENYDDLIYVYLPEELDTDIETFERRRLANCRSFAYHADRLSRLHGIESRISTGLLVAIPYCTQHSWVEFRSGGEWVAVEPLLASLIASKDARQQREQVERRLVGLFTRWGGEHADFFQPAHLFRELRATAHVITSPPGD